MHMHVCAFVLYFTKCILLLYVHMSSCSSIQSEFGSTCMSANACAHPSANMYAYNIIYIYTYIYIYIYIHIYLYTHIYILLYILIILYIYTYTCYLFGHRNVYMTYFSFLVRKPSGYVVSSTLQGMLTIL